MAPRARRSQPPAWSSTMTAVLSPARADAPRHSVAREPADPRAPLAPQHVAGCQPLARRPFIERELQTVFVRDASRLKSVALRYLRHDADAEDAVQDTFLAAHRKRHTFVGSS